MLKDLQEWGEASSAISADVDIFWDVRTSGNKRLRNTLVWMVASDGGNPSPPPRLAGGLGAAGAAGALWWPRSATWPQAGCKPLGLMPQGYHYVFDKLR